MELVDALEILKDILGIMLIIGQIILAYLQIKKATNKAHRGRW